MRTCPDCKKEISSSASTCPNCGRKFTTAAGCIGGIILGLVLAYFFLQWAAKHAK